MDKQLKIKEQIQVIDECLAAAEEYVRRNVNVEGSSWLYRDDWKGRSGHPLWMKNYMIPCAKRLRSRKEKNLETISRKCTKKTLQRRRRRRIDS